MEKAGLKEVFLCQGQSAAYKHEGLSDRLPKEQVVLQEILGAWGELPYFKN